MKYALLIIGLSISSFVLSQNYQKLDSISEHGGKQYKFLYDAHGYNTAHIVFEWDGNFVNFMPVSKREYEYDSIGNCSLILYLTYDKINEKWEKASKVEMSYDNNNNINQYFNYLWVNNSWEFNTRVDHENIYENGLLKTAHYHYYSSKGYHHYKCDFAYNPENSLVEIIYRDFDPETGQNVTENYTRYAIISDSINNVISAIKYKWRSFGGQWREETKVENTFDNNYKTNDLLFDIFYSSNVLKQPLQTWVRFLNVNHMITHQKHYYYSLSSFSWRLNNELIYHYLPELITGTKQIEKIKEQNVSIYPNPAEKFINIELKNQSFAKIEIYNQLGQKIISEVTFGNMRIPVNNFKSGYYFVRVTCNNELFSQKIYLN